MEVFFEIIGALVSGLFEEIFEGIFEIIGKKYTEKKIERHIERLQHYSWFKVLYEDERYHDKFVLNKQVRRYLKSSARVRRLINSEKSREQLVTLLQTQNNRIEKGGFI